jgi:HEAT repeat protein
VADQVDDLIADLNSSDPDIRYNAISPLYKSGDPRAVDPLIQALNDENFIIRFSAAAYLGGLNDTRAVDPLIRALNDEEESVREAAAESLGKLGDERAIKPLTNIASHDTSKNVREDAEKAIVMIKAANNIKAEESPLPLSISVFSLAVALIIKRRGGF